MAKCGQSYSSHQRRGEEVCDECKAERRAYMKQYRARINDLRKARGELVTTPRALATSRAKTRLTKLYPATFYQLVEEELVREREREKRRRQ